MSALVKNSPTPANAAIGASRGFGLGVEEAAKAEDQIGRAVMTVLLVLYPALATVAIVVAAFLLTGNRLLA